LADERWAGVMEERVANLPKKADLDSVRNESLSAIEKLSANVERMLEKHERATAEAIRVEVTKTVEAAFNLQWQKIENLIAVKVPERPKRDWVPVIAVLGMGAIVGLERLVPQLLRLMGF
jgi:hypothetical protein